MCVERVALEVCDDHVESNLDQSKRDQEDKKWDDFLMRNAKDRKIGNQGVLTES